MQESEVSGNEKNGYQQRKLAAIMFTDMVGYSALSQKNESLSILLLEEHRKILRNIFVKHSGREIETIGDAFFVEFNSAVQAANCAIEIQKTLHERNLSAEHKIELRIGMHVGDVLFYEDHVHGDGVNIAARLEPLSPPGGICISEDFAHATINKLEYPIQKKGSRKLKNIKDPINIYCIALPWLKGKQNRIKKTFGFSFPQKIAAFIIIFLILISAAYLLLFNSSSHMSRRIAVLPFVNIGGSPDDAYFAEGMTEQLISNLSNIGGLNVIARSSIMKYQDGRKDINTIGGELNVGTILEGSIRKSMNTARITVQLIDVSTQENIWAKYYDREIKDIFLIQSDIANSIARELKVKLQLGEVERLRRSKPMNMEAYNHYSLGRFYFNKRSSEGVMTSISYYKKAIELDSLFAEAYAGLSDAYTLIASADYGNGSIIDARKEAKKDVMKALEIDPNLGEAYASLAYINFRIEWDLESAEINFQKSIDLQPSYAQAHEWYGLYLALRGRLKEGLAEMQRAAELNPLSVSVTNGIGRIYHFMGKYDEAIAQYKKALMLSPNYAEAFHSIGMLYIVQKKYYKAVTELRKAVELSGRNIMKSNLGLALARGGKREEALEILNDLKINSEKDEVSGFLIPIYAGLKDNEKLYECLDKAYAEKSGILLFMKADPLLGDYKNDPKMNEIIKKIGL